MERGLTLLERLAGHEKDEYLTISEDTQQLVDSIMRHLRRMLNTRQGHVPIQPDYGMPDITDCARSLPETLDKVRRAIKSSIETFEPRLRRVRISQLPSDDILSLHFGIAGQLVTTKEAIPVFFSTRVRPSGGVEVTPGGVGDYYEGSGSRGSVGRPDRGHL